MPAVSLSHGPSNPQSSSSNSPSLQTDNSFIPYDTAVPQEASPASSTFAAAPADLDSASNSNTTTITTTSYTDSSTPPPSQPSSTMAPSAVISPLPPHLHTLHSTDYLTSKSSMSSPASSALPSSLLSPALPPVNSTPASGATTPLSLEPKSHPVAPHAPSKNLLKELPKVNCEVRARIPTTHGSEIFLHLYTNSIDNKEHLAIVFGDKIRSKSLDAVRPGETEQDRMIRGAYTGRLRPGRTNSRFDDSPAGSPQVGAVADPLEEVGLGKTTEANKQVPLVRIHSECYTGETAWSARCDCGEQLDEAARLMSTPSISPSGGCIVYLRQEGRGIGLGEKLKAYNLQDLGNDTVQANLLLRHPADARSYGLATSILMDLGLEEIRLLTNNPEKIAAVEGPGREVRVRERVAMVPIAWRGGEGGVRGREVGEYLKTKIQHMGHMLELPQ